ncbi:MAG: hypothetical protein K0S93_847, partial [Nitrososphaeraceae archaeon]|nr:hypothetical protein [Nitrososphaeraceae archaeon]
RKRKRRRRRFHFITASARTIKTENYLQIQNGRWMITTYDYDDNMRKQSTRMENNKKK